MTRNRCYVLLATLAMLLASASAQAQLITGEEYDPEAERTADPARNRLMAMSTGLITPKGNVVVGIHEIGIGSVTYSPLDWLQLGGMVTPLAGGRYTVGAKVALVRDVSFVRGIAVGVDMTTFGLMTGRPTPVYTIAGSFGVGRLGVHASVEGETETDGYDAALAPDHVKIGGTYELGSGHNALLWETWLSKGRSGSRFEPVLSFGGYRHVGETFSWEAGLAFSHEKGSLVPDSGYETYLTLPYVSGSWKF